MQAGAYDTVLILFYFSLSLFLSVCLRPRATPFFATADVYPSLVPSYFRLPTNQSGNNFALPLRVSIETALVHSLKTYRIV